MKINNNVFSYPNKPFDIKRTDEIPECSQSDILLAILLTHLQNFYEDIENIRKEVAINEITKYKDIRSLIELYVQINEKSQFHFEKLIDEILLKYHLTGNWNLSILAVVLTNILLIPEKNIAIQVHVPDDFYKDEVVEYKHKVLQKNIETKGVQRATQEAYPVIKYPAIFFTQYIRSGALVSWVLANRKTIEAIRYFLPKEQDKRIKIETIHWGHLVWTLKEAGFSGWTEIAVFLEKVAKNSFKDSDNGDNSFEVVPTPDELAKQYKSYIKTLKKVVPDES